MSLSGTLFSWFTWQGFFFSHREMWIPFQQALMTSTALHAKFLENPWARASGVFRFFDLRSLVSGKNERHRLHLKIIPIGIWTSSSQSTIFLGSSRLFSRMISWKTINFMQVKQFILEASTFLRFHYRWSHCHVLLWESHLRWCYRCVQGHRLPRRRHWNPAEWTPAKRRVYRSPETGHVSSVSSFSWFSPLNHLYVSIRNRFHKSLINLARITLASFWHHFMDLHHKKWPGDWNALQSRRPVPPRLRHSFPRLFSPAISVPVSRSGLRFQWQGGQRLRKKLETTITAVFFHHVFFL